VRHIRNLLIARVSGADSDLIAATPDQRPAIAKAAALFSEEDLTRFFQILLQTDDDLRRKPDPRVHLEMGLLKLDQCGTAGAAGRVARGVGQRFGRGTASRTAASAAPAIPVKREMASAAAAGAFSSPTPESAAPARETFPVREARLYAKRAFLLRLSFSE